MSIPILATKLSIPSPRPNVVRRARLLERLRQGLSGRLILISAPAGFGKTTLISDWLADGEHPAAWLSLDAGENDPARFLGYLVAAVQTLAPTFGAGVMAALQSPQPPSTEAMLTALLNDFTALPDPFLLVLDDYHSSAAPAVDQALTFLLEHLPPQLHLVLATREDPHLPLARLRASVWFEEQGLGLEAFQHAAAAHDVDRAARLLESKGMPRQFRGTVKAILDWLGSLSTSELYSRPGLLVRVVAAGGRMPDYIGRVLAGFAVSKHPSEPFAYLPSSSAAQPLLDPLSPRELEVLRLIAQGRSDQEIAGRLHVALSTVKGHNRKIFDKLQVQRRTEAVARARELGLL